MRKEPSVIWYGVLGMFFGIVLLKAEVVSWFRIQEMFRFQSFHMYGIIGAAVGVGTLSVFLMKRAGPRTVRGETIAFPSGAETRPRKHHVYGGIAFGLGWGLIGACPGPLFALVGSGLPIMLVGLLAALAGAWSYGDLRPRLPH